ncbi:GNAT family N-acetyltransferase [Gillisia sp. Q332]|uniref:GNAT family N-acetyltransferase n=1 Tax=Gillisia xinjiangensis TaxID=3384765 RepID=UPI00391CE07A
MDSEDLEKKISIFFSKIRFGRFLSDRYLKQEDALNLETKRFLKYVETGHVIFIVEKNELCGLIGFRESEWDSKHFGYKVAKIDYFLMNENYINSKNGALLLIDSFHLWINEQNIKVAITKIDSNFFDVSEALQKNNYIFYECITYRNLRKLNLMEPTFDSTKYRFANPEDITQIKSIALSNTFEKSHLFLDNKFETEKVQAMYVKWIETALNPLSKDRVIVIEEDNEIAGTFIYSLPNLPEFPNLKFSKFEFLAINKKFRKRGLGKKLFEAAILSSINDGVDIIDSTLVDKNIISQNIHEEYNFKLVNTFYTFHKWF